MNSQVLQVEEVEIHLHLLEEESDVFSFDIFRNKKGKFLCWLSLCGNRKKTFRVVDVESGKFIKKMTERVFSEIPHANHEIFEDIPKHHCLVGMSYSTLFAIHYEDDYRIESNIFNDVFENRFGFCIYDERNIACLSENDPLLVYFFDFEKRKVIGRWSGEEDRLNTSIVSSNHGSNMKKKKEASYLFLESVGRLGSASSGTTRIHILDSIKYTELYQVAEKNNQFSISVVNFFFDYTCNSKALVFDDFSNNIFSYTLPKEMLSDQQKVIPEIYGKEVVFQHKIKGFFYPRYSFGNFYFGMNEQSKKIISVSSGESEHREYTEYDIISGTRIKEHGKDVFIVLRNKDGIWKIMHFVNTLLCKNKIDPDEKERVDYLSNLDIDNMEGLKLLKISIFGLEFFCMKLFFQL